MQACLDLFFLRLFSAAMNLSSAGVTASDHDGPAILSVGEVARRSGITVSALHFYERQGLIESLRTPTQADWSALSARWRHALDARIQGLTQLRDQIDGCIGCGCLSLKVCPLRNDGDCLAKDGPGPHFR